jgi:hypothetical protein
MCRLRVPFAALGVLLAGCSLLPTPSVGPPTAPTFDVGIDTPDGPVGLVRSENSIGLYLHSSDGGTYQVTTVPSGSPPTVHLYSQGGATGRQINTFVFGDAPAGAMEVVVNGSRAAVTDGLYVVGLAIRELRPDAVVWSFLGGGDEIIVQGSGIKD